MRTMVDRNDEINRRTVVSWGKACPSLEFCNLCEPFPLSSLLSVTNLLLNLRRERLGAH